MVQNIVLLFWKLLAYAGQIEFLETAGCLMLALKVESVFPLDSPRQKMSSTVIMIYSMDVLSRLVSLTIILYFYYLISLTV